MLDLDNTLWGGVIGDDEAASGSVKLKNMETGEDTLPSSPADAIIIHLVISYP